MHGLWIEDGELTLRDDLPAPTPESGEVRVRVSIAGVCSTDLALRRGYMGFRGIPGHEFVGIALDGKHAGQRVVGEINAGCGNCDRCRGGLDRHCPNRTVLGIFNRHGCFAEELVLPERNLLPVPDEISDEQAVFVEPLAAGFEIAEQLPLTSGMRALVVGDGRLGLLCAWVLRENGVDVTLAGRHPDRVEFIEAGRSAKRGSLDHVTGWFEADAHEGAMDFDLAVEATGNPDILARLFTHVRPRGTIVMKTTSERPATVDFAPAVVHELTLLGSRCGRFAPALEALAPGGIDPRPLVHARAPLTDAVAAFDRASQPGVLKVLVDIG